MLNRNFNVKHVKVIVNVIYYVNYNDDAAGECLAALYFLS